MGKQKKLDIHFALWHNMVLPRHSFILWVIVQRRLLTLDRLQTCIPLVSEVSCVLCEERLETHDHLFFECSYSWRLLHLCTSWMALTAVPHKLQQWHHWLAHVTRRKLWKYGAWSAMFAVLIYHIWEERNGRKHGVVPCTEDQRFRRLKGQVMTRVHAAVEGYTTREGQAFMQSLQQQFAVFFFASVFSVFASE